MPDPLYLEIDQLLQQFKLFGINLGLAASLDLLAELGNPHRQIPVLHVAGSNGKGSVCAYLSAVLTAAGYKVGRYTSPHLIHWCDRICIHDRPIPPADLYAVLRQVKSAIRSDRPSSTQFEVITAAMWLYFAQQQVDVAVVEVGLGGRLDATNVIDRPLVSLITSISREHWQRLGSTLGQIAGEKAGILKPHCPAAIAPLPEEAQLVVQQRIADLNCPAVFPAPAQDLGDGWAQTEDGLKYQLPLLGAIQLQNSALAIAALRLLQQQGWNISDAAIAEGIAHTRWAGRLQWYTWQQRQILIDGAHNPAGAAGLRQYVDTLDRHPVQWVMGMLTTKDHADVFQALLRPGDKLFLVPVPGYGSAAPEDLAAIAQTICPNLAHCQTYPDVYAGLEAALATEALTVLCGSLYLIGDFFATQQRG
jgi:dihydrofolate synthase/folylpolyglutamate synthase